MRTYYPCVRKFSCVLKFCAQGKKLNNENKIDSFFHSLPFNFLENKQHGCLVTSLAKLSYHLPRALQASNFLAFYVALHSPFKRLALLSLIVHFSVCAFCYVGTHRSRHGVYVFCFFFQFCDVWVYMHNGKYSKKCMKMRTGERNVL